MAYKVGDQVVTMSRRWPTAWPLVVAGTIVGTTNTRQAYKVRSFRRRFFWGGRVEVWMAGYEVIGLIIETAPDGTHIEGKK